MIIKAKPDLNEHKIFQKIADIPYEADYESNIPKNPKQLYEDGFGDCDDKAVAFLQYLYDNGERDIYFIIATHPQGYAHAYAVWNNYIYDPTSKPLQYKVEPQEYQKILDRNGFTGQLRRKYIGYERMWRI